MTVTRARAHVAAAIVASALAVACVAALAALPVASAQAPTQAVRDTWVARMPKAGVLSLKDPGGLFTMDYPRRDWTVVPGAGPIVATIVNKKGDAAIVIEQAVLKQPLAPADITELFAELELELVRERQPRATDFQSRVIGYEGRTLAALQFVRPGVTGMERVRQFSIPAGLRLYRVSCVAALGSFAANETWFAHAAATFLPVTME